jgi:hypothetical protein
MKKASAFGVGDSAKNGTYIGIKEETEQCVQWFHNGFQKLH